jgi:hypothetical protein
MKRETVYIIGKVGDLSDDDYYQGVYEKFALREKMLCAMGLAVVNPMRLIPRDTIWRDAMKKCISAMLSCDKVSPLPDTWYSEGGMIEFNLSQKLRMPVILPAEENML